MKTLCLAACATAMRLTTLHKVPGPGCPETCRSIRMVLISSPPTYFRLSHKGTLPGFGLKQFLCHAWDVLCSGSQSIV
ncbi:hypothetical protein DFH09DRAFT_172242 [Mycena vulgaris]|nr:hypothetical protein DFH09DRAFT_172242 [Mycena vulgaris]